MLIIRLLWLYLFMSLCAPASTINITFITAYNYMCFCSRYKVTHEALQKRFIATVRHWLQVRKTTIRKVRETAENLEKYHQSVNISRIVGSTVSAVGSGAVIAGFALAPFTLGGSLSVSLLGLGASALGGATTAGASIVDTFIEKSNIKDIQKQLDDDNLQVEVIEQMAKDIQEAIETTQASIQVGSAVAIGIQVVTGAARIGNVGMKATEIAASGTLQLGAAALRAGGSVAKGVAGVALSLNIVMIPIDLAEIIRSGYRLRNGSLTEAVEKLNTLAVQLQEQMESLKNETKINDE